MRKRQRYPMTEAAFYGRVAAICDVGVVGARQLEDLLGRCNAPREPVIVLRVRSRIVGVVDGKFDAGPIVDRWLESAR